MNKPKFDTISTRHLDAVIGGSILGNAAIGVALGAGVGSFFPGPGTAVGGLVGGTIAGAYTMGQEAAKHSNDLTKFDWL
jgi:hypothetical protein